jgi:uncharacterized protein YyaL (SSP411 family)
MSTNKKANRLIHEKSPYLLQHAYNPVDWFPWSDEAFEKAKAEDKPIFLSIGYSTCHWCHVMEKESFEDEEVAKILNKHYVSIKVDRELRPDIDHIYMRVCQGITGSGGWPLSIFMTPDQKPFYAGTYFPKETKGRYLGFIDILTYFAKLWETDKERLYEDITEIDKYLKKSMVIPSEEPDIKTIDKAYRLLKADYDPKYGGFGTAPKFPTPHNLLFLLRYYKITSDTNALHMAEQAIIKIF